MFFCIAMATRKWCEPIEIASAGKANPQMLLTLRSGSLGRGFYMNNLCWISHGLRTFWEKEKGFVPINQTCSLAARWQFGNGPPVMLISKISKNMNDFWISAGLRTFWE
jgi:hypothetical protein